MQAGDSLYRHTTAVTTCRQESECHWCELTSWFSTSHGETGMPHQLHSFHCKQAAGATFLACIGRPREEWNRSRHTTVLSVCEPLYHHPPLHRSLVLWSASFETLPPEASGRLGCYHHEATTHTHTLHRDWLGYLLGSSSVSFLPPLWVGVVVRLSQRYHPHPSTHCLTVRLACLLAHSRLLGPRASFSLGVIKED